MVINPFKAFLFIAGGASAAVATAYVSGALDPYLAEQRMAAVATLPDDVAPADPTSPPKGERLPQPAPEDPAKAPAAATPAKPEVAPAKPTAEATSKPTAGPAAAVIAPSFDVVRAEPDGSIVIAGKAAPGASVEIVAGARALGATTAGKDGDFAIVLDEPLQPGNHELVLRSTGEDKVVATSPETAVVAIPDQKDGQVLALVEKPGEPSKLITVPEPMAPKQPEPAAPKPEAEAPGDKPQEPVTAEAKTPPADQKRPPAATLEQPENSEPAPSAAQPDKPAAPAAQPAETATEPKVAVDAVEIEGREVFVAGAADPGRRVRAYANDILLGEALASPGGRFLIEAERDLPVGDYIIRADALEPNGDKVLARAAVPFEREPGEAVAAVAPEAPLQKPAGEPAPASEPKAAVPAVPSTTEVQPDAPTETQAAAQPPVGQGEGDANTAPAPDQKIAAGDPSTVAPKLQSVDGSVIIRRGDTLWRISRRVYGRGVRYSTIYLANQDQIRDPDRIWPGQVFNVPEKTPEGEAADMTAVKKQSTPPAPKAPL